MDNNELEIAEKNLEALEQLYYNKKDKWLDEWYVKHPDGGDIRHYLEYVDSFDDLHKTEHKIIQNLERTIRMNKPYTLSKISDFGDRMSLEHFIDNVKCGGFIDYDGFGLYVKDGQETDIHIYPSDIMNNTIRNEFTEIIWFNR
jgi:hypothetical protein